MGKRERETLLSMRTGTMTANEKEKEQKQMKTERRGGLGNQQQNTTRTHCDIKCETRLMKYHTKRQNVTRQFEAHVFTSQNGLTQENQIDTAPYGQNQVFVLFVPLPSDWSTTEAMGSERPVRMKIDPFA